MGVRANKEYYSALRTGSSAGSFKLIRYAQGYELYDLTADPYETLNVYTSAPKVRGGKGGGRWGCAPPRELGRRLTLGGWVPQSRAAVQRRAARAERGAGRRVAGCQGREGGAELSKRLLAASVALACAPGTCPSATCCGHGAH